jgi:hypothetical protein
MAIAGLIRSRHRRPPGRELPGHPVAAPDRLRARLSWLGLAESFNGKPRYELLAREGFDTLLEDKVLIE